VAFDYLKIRKCLDFFVFYKKSMTLVGLFSYLKFYLNPNKDSFYLQKKKTVYDAM